MTHDAQQAADAAMVEINEHCYPADDPPFLIVHPTWLRTFLANFLAGWQAEIGGERAAVIVSSEGERSGAGDTSDRPATPIDTEALAVDAARTVFATNHTCGSADQIILAVKRILDEAIGGQ